MQEIVKGYGKFIIAGLVTLTALVWVFSYGFYGQDEGEVTGIMGLVGKEATVKEEDTNANRVGPEMEAVGANAVSIRCLGVPRLGEKIKLADLFLAQKTSGGDNTTYPVVVTDVVDEHGRGLRDFQQKISYEGNEITVNKAGIYQFYVKVLPCRKTEMFTICVTDKEEI